MPGISSHLRGDVEWTGTQYTYAVNSDTSISTQTVGQNPALLDVQICTVTACSLNPPADQFILYPPGNPIVTSITPTSGSAAGGTSVTITGENLGCVTGVFFGTVAAATPTDARPPTPRRFSTAARPPR